MTFQGLTWDHPRGYDALAEAARRVNAYREAPLVAWQKQPLEGFESAPIADLAARYDLIVLDHPHIGEAVAEDCLIPLDDLFAPQQIAAWQHDSIGPALASYHWQGRIWAVPLDVATQVVARRADRISEAPESWDEIEHLAQSLPVAMSLGGPHACLTWMSLVASTGASVGGAQLVDDAAAVLALERMHRLFQNAPGGSDALNPIGLLETMARSDDIALIPLIFGYVTYARTGHAPHVVTFSDTPCSAGGRAGVLGGTGIGFSRRATPSQDLLDHVAWLMTEAVQTDLFPDFGGQPSARAAWRDPKVNQAWGSFYTKTAATAENALLRPRFDGYIAFQTAASNTIRAALKASDAPEHTLATLRMLWRKARSAARGPIDTEGQHHDG